MMSGRRSTTEPDAVERLLVRLADTPTPAGPTPRRSSMLPRHAEVAGRRFLGREQGRPHQEVGVEEKPVLNGIEVDVPDLVRADLVSGWPGRYAGRSRVSRHE
jgi:hypothetical protein